MKRALVVIQHDKRCRQGAVVPERAVREIPRDLHEHARDVARRLMRTKGFVKSCDERKRVEMRFGHLKTHHGFERMRLRGLSGDVTNSISPPLCRTSKRWRTMSGGRRQTRRLHSLCEP